MVLVPGKFFDVRLDCGSRQAWKDNVAKAELDSKLSHFQLFKNEQN